MESDGEVCVDQDYDQDCDQDYDETVNENVYLSEVFKKYSTPKDFLHRTEKIFARSIALDSAACGVWLNFDTDVDGCVVELTDLSGVCMPIRHLTICPYGVASLKEVKGVLKKHVDLVAYSSDELFNFNQAVGIQLFYENGWECWLAFIPIHSANSVKLTKELIRHVSYNAFLTVRSELRKKLAEYAGIGVARRTLMKNDLNDLQRIFVLPDDCYAILAALQSVLNGVKVSNFIPVVFCFRFGEKMSQGLSLRAFKKEFIRKVTVHAAVDISSSVSGIELMWSMTGLQELAGVRGTLGTCLSFTDCGNFQSNVDGRAIDIKHDLRGICVHPDKLTFVQLYADVPHLKPKTRFHPVSGTVVAGLCLPYHTANAYFRDAETYVSVLEHNFALLTKSTCRLEVVVELDKVTDFVHATDCVDLLKLGTLLQDKPLLVPIPSETLTCIRAIGIWLTTDLKEVLEKFNSTGNVSATWQAYQLELACEKLLWGRPLCGKSSRYSVNLGPGMLVASRSLTDHLGFLALESPSACMYTDDSVPPYSLWTTSDAVGKSIVRAAGLHDHLNASYPVIGRRLIVALLKDLHEVGKAGVYCRFEDFLSEMISRNTRFQTVGAITVRSLCDLLSVKRRTALHMVFGSLCKIVEKADLPLAEVIKAGIEEMRLLHFPAVQTYDTHGHASLNWTFRNNFWTVASDKPCNTLKSHTVYSELVRGELERRGLIYPSKLKTTPTVLPWIDCCLRKLTRENLPEESTINVLTFISCIAFIMDGWFIDFDRLSDLLSKLAVSQQKLKALEIQSKLELPNFKFKHMTLYRLHHSIPHQMKIREYSCLLSVSNLDEVNREDGSAIHSCCTRKIGDDDDNVVGQEEIEHRSSTCRSVQVVKKAWSGKELEILHEVAEMRKDKGLLELYSIFRTKCMKENTAFRTYRAFQNKIDRLV